MKKLIYLLLFLVVGFANAQRTGGEMLLVSQQQFANESVSERKHEIVIQSSQVPANATDFTVLITKDNLDVEVIDAGGNSAQANGDDIIFTSDAAGTTRLSIDIVEFIPHATEGNRKCEIWVKVPSVLGASNTSIWIWYKHPTRTQPAFSASFGRDAVWTGNDTVHHLQEDPSGSAPQSIDSTGNTNDGTANGTMLTGDLIDGQIGNALDYDGTDDYTNIPYDASYDKTSNFTISFWFKLTNTWDTNSTVENGLVGRSSGTSGDSDWALWLRTSDNGRMRFVTFGGNTQSATASWTGGTWYHVVLRYVSGTESYFYINSSLDTYNSDTNPGPIDGFELQPLTLGLATGSEGSGFFYLDGILDEVKLYNTAVSADWILTEYNNQSNPNAFAIEQTPTDDTF